MSNLIHRVTLFKLQGADKQAQLLAAYEKLAKEQNKDGKPYIQYLCAGLANPDDPRSKGITVMAQTKFKSLQDMQFYDAECAAHQELKSLVKTLGIEEPPTTLYYDSAPLVDLTH